MRSVELTANLFRISQTEDVLDKHNINKDDGACNTHYNVDKTVRNTIKKIKNKKELLSNN